MNVYSVTLTVYYGKYICIVTSNNYTDALNLALHELQSNPKTLYDNEVIGTYVEELHLLPKDNKEEVVFIDGYEE